MDIKKSIKSIKEKYGLSIREGELYESRIKNKIIEVLNNIPDDKTVAIRGAGEHTEELLSLGYYNDKFICIFDYSEQKKETRIIAGKEWEVYPCSAIDRMDIDIIVISSYTHRKKSVKNWKNIRRILLY